MDTPLRPLNSVFSDWRRWLVFLCSAVFTLFLTINHETWGDELDAWNVMKSGTAYLDLLLNSAYYLHPTSWNTILWLAAQFSHSLSVLPVASYLTAIVTAFLIVFLSRFRLSTCVVILLGYYLLFEYNVFARGYGLATMLTMLACVASNSNRPKPGLFYFSLFLLSNTHMFGFFLAAGLYAHRLASLWHEKERRKELVCAALVLLPAAFIDILAFLQSTTDLPMTAGHRIWNVLQAPVRAFLPMPAWWGHHFWNTQFLLEGGITVPFIKYLSLFLSCLFVVLILKVFDRSQSRWLILVFFSLQLSFGLLFPLVSARYVGFLYISFLAALWLNGGIPDGWRRTCVFFFLIMQVPGGMYSAAKELLLPFSQVKATSAVAAKIPTGKPVITDFGAMNFLSAVTDKGYYCVGANSVISSVPLLPNALYLVNGRDRYTVGTYYYMDSTHVNEVYLMSTRSPERILIEDRLFFDTLSVVAVDSAVGAIEKFSDLYLYRVRRK